MKIVATIPALAFLVFWTTNIKAQTHMDTYQNLNRKQQDIVGISALTANGDVVGLKRYLGNGLDDGMTISEIREILVQLYAYCGFPRSLNGINAFMSVLDERKQKGIADAEGRDATPVVEDNKYETGRRNLQTLTGVEEKGPKKGANGFAPAIDSFLKEHLFADIFSRDVLTFQQRELVTVSALAAMSGVEPQLQAHIGMGMNTGLTAAQLKDAFVVIDAAVGRKEGDIARTVLDKVLAARK